MRIAIVGAGPAGCHLAYCLADAGHDVLLFDPRVPGYEKPCGGGLSPLVGQHFPEVMALPFARHCPPRLILRASDGSQIEQPLQPSTWAIVSRADFGSALFRRAMANDRCRHVRQQVTGMVKAGEGWRLRTASHEVFPADFLVGADGAQSLVRRRVVGPIPRQHLGLAVGYQVQGAPDAMIFQTFADLHGYLWSFPRPDGASVGIGSRLGTAPPQELWLRVDRFLTEMCPGAHKGQRWATLLPMACDSSLWDMPCTGPGWALLGDAAGHVHPITGEGIAYALWSAELLAEAFSLGDPERYESLWRKKYGGGLVAAGTLLSSVDKERGAYEVVLQMTMVATAQSPGRSGTLGGENDE